jgi:iron-sulfur cluster insertion protein
MIFTNAAAAKVADLMKAEINPNTNLRISVEGGGCSGFTYKFMFDEIIAEDDTVTETDGVKLLVDPISFQYLSEAEIDYSEGGLSGSRFVIKNPNAKSTCGCGESFTA